jgi:hypothetical protein
MYFHSQTKQEIVSAPITTLVFGDGQQPFNEAAGDNICLKLVV